MLNDNHVAVFQQKKPKYSSASPYHPPQRYPESPYKKNFDSQNEVYQSIRSIFKYLRFDIDNYSTPNWNPLGCIVTRGDTVLVKPNMIAQSHRYSDEWEHVITHGSVIRAIIDYLFIALEGEGRIIIADAPQTDSNIDLIKKRMGIDAIQDLYWSEKKYEIEFIDLRNEHWVSDNGIYIKTVNLPGDPRGNVKFNLGKESFLSEHDDKGKEYYGAFYDIDETNAHHKKGIHEYLISKTAIECDAFVSLPKMKTHKKVGVTLNLKGLVGINGNKNWLPHYTIGMPEDNGDQFSGRGTKKKLENFLVLKAKKLLLNQNSMIQKLAVKLKSAGYYIFGNTESVVRSGNWYGNDTCWRMALDLNRILLYGNSDGTMKSYPKKYFSLVDGVIGMEGNGPVAGTSKGSGVLIGGRNPLAVDMICSRMIGFDYKKIPMLYRALDQKNYALSNFKPENIIVYSNLLDLKGNVFKKKSTFNLRFEPHFGWKKHLTLSD